RFRGFGERAMVRRLPGRKNRPVNGQFATYGQAHSSLLEVCDTHVIVVKMAGPIRQPIDIPALQRYIEQNVPQIKTPLEVKQVGTGTCSHELIVNLHAAS